MKGWLDKFKDGGKKKKTAPKLDDVFTKLGISAKNFIDPMAGATAVSDATRKVKPAEAKRFEMRRDQLSATGNKNEELSNFYKVREAERKAYQKVGEAFQAVGAITEPLALIPTPITETLGIIGGAANAVGSAALAANDIRDENYLGALGNLAIGATSIPGAALANPMSLRSLATNLPKARSVNEAIGAAFANITPASALPRMTSQELKTARGVQDIGRLRATGAPESKQIKKALDIGLPENQFRDAFGVSRNDAIAMLNNPTPVPSIADDVRDVERDLMYDLFGRRSTNSDRDRLNQIFRENSHLNPEDFGNLDPSDFTNNVRGADLDLDGNEMSQSFRDRLDAHVARRSQEVVSPDVYAEQRARLEAARQRLDSVRRRAEVSESQSFIDQAREIDRMNAPVYAENYDPNDYVDDYVDQEPDYDSINYRSPSTVSRNSSFVESRDNLRESIENATRNFMQPYKNYNGPVTDRLGYLVMDESGTQGARNAVQNALAKSRELDSVGDVVTGSLSTSHNSYLPQLKTIFGEGKSLGNPVYLGDKPMNSMGFLNRFGYSPEEIAKYMNTEIDQLIKKGKVPNDILRPRYSPTSGGVELPHYGIEKTTESILNKTFNKYNSENLPDLPFENGGELNYNDYSVSAPEGFVGDGYSNAGRNYSPAWGGQFAMGGSMPGAVGFTYARVAGSAPANGKYTKKTMASAQNGTEMRYYQEGLDWKPKTISRDGSQLVKLDQLTNFTNYNTKQPGGWLDKYEG